MKNPNSLVRNVSLTALAILVQQTGFAKGNERVKSEDQKHPNVLFIALDDLRPELGCYGNRQIISPNMDKLARDGVKFNRAYCQQAVCMASRASLMTGLRPDTLNFYNLKSIDELCPDILTLNRHFENNGYQIWASGKIFGDTGSKDHIRQFRENFHHPKTNEVGRGYLNEASIKTVKEYDSYYREKFKSDALGRGPAYESAEVADNAYLDGAMTDLAVDQLKKFKSSAHPFFMAVGFAKPHLPFCAPKKYWDMYNPNEIAMASNPYKTANISKFFEYTFGELRNYAGIPKGQVAFSDTLSRNLKHGYYACVTYVDAQIGRLLKALEENGLDKNTIIILWGDHGWKLGEHGMWCKHTLYEIDNHVPLLLKVPGQKKHKGTDAFVEFVDIYPSLCELAGIPTPAKLHGKSFVPLIKNPEKKWKNAAYSMWPVNYNNPETLILGYSIKTDRYRYTEWIRQKDQEVVERDLFDHKTDPGENNDIAKNPESIGIMNQLSKILDKGNGWRNSMKN